MFRFRFGWVWLGWKMRRRKKNLLHNPSFVLCQMILYGGTEKSSGSFFPTPPVHIHYVLFFLISLPLISFLGEQEETKNQKFSNDRKISESCRLKFFLFLLFKKNISNHKTYKHICTELSILYNFFYSQFFLMCLFCLFCLF